MGCKCAGAGAVKKNNISATKSNTR
jgi:hypothetical protein